MGMYLTKIIAVSRQKRKSRQFFFRFGILYDGFFIKGVFEVDQSLTHTVRLNWKSGITVALLSLPLSVSLAIASNTTPTVGIITAIWSGLIASFFGGSHFNVIGPTGALSGILAINALTYGPSCLPAIAILAGLFILVAYWFRVDRYLTFIPSSVLHGFTLGIAIILILSQLNFAFGLSGLPKHAHLFENVHETLKHVSSINVTTCLIFVGFLALLFLAGRTIKQLPPVLLVAPVGILFGCATTFQLVPISLKTLSTEFGSIQFALAQWHMTFPALALLIPSLTIAVIAILETMMSARIADVMTKTKHDKTRELLGLGLSNIVSGCMGGMPATAALARTALNIKAGCTHKTSATISSIGIGLASAFFLPLFKFMPLAIIAAILVFVACNMIEVHHLKSMWQMDKRGLVIALLVAYAAMYADPLVGIMLGTAMAMVFFMEKLSLGSYEILETKSIAARTEELTPENDSSSTLIYAIKGPLAYINAQSHIAYLEQHSKPYKNVILKVRDLTMVDPDGLQALSEIIEMIETQKKTVIVTGIRPNGMVQHSKKVIELKQKGHTFKTAAEALQYLDQLTHPQPHMINTEVSQTAT